jgi:hypothetical protein
MEAQQTKDSLPVPAQGMHAHAVHMCMHSQELPRAGQHACTHPPTPCTQRPQPRSVRSRAPVAERVCV